MVSWGWHQQAASSRRIQPLRLVVICVGTIVRLGGHPDSNWAVEVWTAEWDSRSTPAPATHPGRRLVDQARWIDALLVFARWGGVARSGPLGGGSVELTRDHHHLARLAEGIGVPGGSFDRFRAVTDEVAVRGHPYLAGPAAAAQPMGADGAAPREVRLVSDEQFPPSLGDGLDVPAHQWCRVRRTRPRDRLLDRRQPAQHRSSHLTIH
jgi:hypothetical protein